MVHPPGPTVGRWAEASATFNNEAFSSDWRLWSFDAGVHEEHQLNQLPWMYPQHSQLQSKACIVPPKPRTPPVSMTHCCVPKRVNFEEVFQGRDATQRITTLMIRNVPNRYDRTMLMKELDQLGFTGSYDFLYLPVDNATNWNVGYAFVNFEEPEDAQRCMKIMDSHQFLHFRHGKRRTAHVSAAHIQGLEQNLAHCSTTSLLSAPAPWLRPWVRKWHTQSDSEAPELNIESQIGAADPEVMGIEKDSPADQQLASTRQDTQGKEDNQEEQEREEAKQKQHSQQEQKEEKEQHVQKQLQEQEQENQPSQQQRQQENQLPQQQQEQQQEQQREQQQENQCQQQKYQQQEHQPQKQEHTLQERQRQRLQQKPQLQEQKQIQFQRQPQEQRQHPTQLPSRQLRYLRPQRPALLHPRQPVEVPPPSWRQASADSAAKAAEAPADSQHQSPALTATCPGLPARRGEAQEDEALVSESVDVSMTYGRHEHTTFSQDFFGEVTSLMLRNVPLYYSEQDLMSELHAMSLDVARFAIYFPVDDSSVSACNFGYAFLNFLSKSEADHAKEVLRNWLWQYTLRTIPTTVDVVDGVDGAQEMAAIMAPYRLVMVPVVLPDGSTPGGRIEDMKDVKGMDGAFVTSFQTRGEAHVQISNAVFYCVGLQQDLQMWPMAYPGQETQGLQFEKAVSIGDSDVERMTMRSDFRTPSRTPSPSPRNAYTSASGAGSWYGRRVQ